MKGAIKIAASVAIILGAILLTAGCASDTRHKWLTVFFDGVPPAGGKTNVPANVSAPAEAAPTNNVPTPAPLPPADLSSVHPAFRDQKCSQCHQSNTGMGLKASQPALCWTCHKDFLAGAKVKHQPVMDGECLSCHDPHRSDNKKLLLKTGKELCMTCHDDPLVGKKFKHQAVEAGECLDCHSPHATNFKGLLKQSVKGTCADCHDDISKKKLVHQPVSDGDCLACHTPHASNNKFLVKKTGPGLCWDCHDNFLEKAKFKHDAVDSCTDCHNPHSTNEKSLLKKNVAILCYDCHDQKDIAAIKGHSGIGDKACTVCHDPHVGTDKNLLKPAAKSPTATVGGMP